jgi:hypothetical protein
LHYPSDLLAGALVGATSVIFMVRMANRNIITRVMLEAEHSYPATFYAGSMLLLMQMMQMFDPLRRIFPHVGPTLSHIFR